VALAEGDIAGTVLVSGAGRHITIPVTGSVEHPPSITSMRVSPSQIGIPGIATRACALGLSVSAAATATDESLPLTYTLTWSPDGKVTRSTTMTADGTTYYGSAGGSADPFVTAGEHTVTVTVTDARGNSAGQSTAVTAVPC
jgi:hypothetical protein